MAYRKNYRICVKEATAEIAIVPDKPGARGKARVDQVDRSIGVDIAGQDPRIMDGR